MLIARSALIGCPGEVHKSAAKWVLTGCTNWLILVQLNLKTPYYYSTFDAENESKASDRKKVIILGSGPNRIGQGIEFDYPACMVYWLRRKPDLRPSW